MLKKSNGRNVINIAELQDNHIVTLELNLDNYSNPSWNADGTKIVFAGTRSGTTEIYLYDVKEKELKQVTNDVHRQKSWPRFSPYPFDDNYRIAYVSEEKGRKDIWWVRESGEFDQPITLPPEKAEEYKKSPYWRGLDYAPDHFPRTGGESPEWAPSGDVIIYRTGENKYNSLSYDYQSWWEEIDISLPAARCLTWAPNQTSFMAYDDKASTAEVISIAGIRKKVFADKVLTSPPTFFPDGKAFAYTFMKNGKSILAVEPYDDPMGDVTNLWMYDYSESEKEKLMRNQLLLLNANYEQIYQIYDSELYSGAGKTHGRPYLVTSDAVLETFYAAFSALYSYVERVELVQALKEFSIEGADVAKQRRVSPDVRNFFLTGLALVDKEAEANVPSEVKREVARIEKASGRESSFFGKAIDYGDFYIRGKYERDTDLQGLFRALKWYQAFNFDLKDPNERKQVAEILSVVSSTRVRSPIEWINLHYKEMIGESRYYGPLTLKELPVAGALPDLKPALPWVRMEKSFRLLPSIYTLDAHIFDELVTHANQPDCVGTTDNPRMLPRGLDLLGALGSSEAKEILLKELGDGRFNNYENKLAALSQQIGKYSRDVWEQNIYNEWLDTLSTLVAAPEEKAPDFVKTKAWKRKQLNTALGSWVNLRYETIAVVEQVSSESGEGGYEQLNVGLPRGYVEPNPLFFRRLDNGFERIAKKFEKEIKEPDLRKAVAERITEYRQHLKRLEEIAQKELDNTTLTADDCQEILYIGRTVEHFILIMNSLSTKDGEAIKEPEPVQKIVDVQKNPMDQSRLYEALGFVNEINVVVPFYGRRQIVKGPVYSYYEFTSPGSLTSEAWRKSGKQQLPSWIEPYYQGSRTAGAPASFPRKH